MKSIVTAGVASASVLLPLAATGEPIVLRFPSGTESINLSDVSNEVPPIRLGRLDIVGGGFTSVAPSIRPEGWNIGGGCEPAPFAGELAQSGIDGAYGAPIDPSQGSWMNAYSCFEFDSNWPQILFGSNDMGCNLPACPPDLALFGTDPDVYIVPLRFEDDQNAWHAAWAAIRVEETVYPECSFCGDNPPVDLVVGTFTYIGFGYESEASTPLINGGGLCEADLNADAVLDLSDIQALVTAFTSQDDAADLDGNGVLDLADLGRFVNGFTTGCGLGL